ncbi:hypothetical protein K490DRAFT_58946 [Saccharata proteae CBS 121410]|uniref:Uncharacterized protein n=1 Tax=Saccharata proteae CBS 121410 TaxID=1314787 RepID=A0A9P4HRI3_9PEZI|nr:hypothetical protein K490DRAFT_58946 [Saccharata proteae CBS 121410]
MEPWQSWLAFFVGAGVVYWYYKAPPPAVRRQVVTDEPARPARKGVEGRQRRSRPMAPASAKQDEAPAQTTSSDTGNAKGRNNKKKGQAVPEKAPVTVTEEVDDKEDETADKEWAQRLSGLMTGTPLQPSERKDTRTKTVKQKAANTEKSGESSAGADADDDLSPALSPNLAASSGVADMLEAPTAGPSVLRLTGSTEDKRAKKPQQKQQESQETKKQRQNRQKVEAAKKQREEDEKARRVLLEKQLRTAREARGEAAKNGVPVSAPTSNAWTSKPAATGAPTNEGPLLDTFEHDGVSTTSSSGAGNSNGSASTAGTDWKGELPSEEEQVRMAMEDSAWNTVTAKKGKKKTETKEAGNVSGGEKTNVAVALPVAQPKAAETTRSDTMSSDSQPGDISLTESGNLQGSGHPQDSDWAVV